MASSSSSWHGPIDVESDSEPRPSTSSKGLADACIPCEICGKVVAFSEYEAHCASHDSQGSTAGRRAPRAPAGPPQSCTVCMCDLEDELILTGDVLDDAALQDGMDTSKDDLALAVTCPRGHAIHIGCLARARQAAAEEGKGTVKCTGPQSGGGCGLEYCASAQRLGASKEERARLTDNALQTMLSDGAIPCPWPACGNHILKTDIPTPLNRVSLPDSRKRAVSTADDDRAAKRIRTDGAGSSRHMDQVQQPGTGDAATADTVCLAINCPACRRAFCTSCSHFPAHPNVPSCREAAAKRQEWDDAVVVHEAANGNQEARRAAMVRRAQILRLRIIDEILTTRCPACHRAFHDFNGCFAITCTCRAHFCGWCLQLCDRDAHPHVIKCARGMGLFAPAAAFQAAQNVMRHAALKTFFDRLPSDEFRSAVGKAIKTDLAELGLNAADYAVLDDVPWLERIWNFAIKLPSLPARIYSTVVKPKELPKEAVPEVEEPCASCGSNAYTVQWRCACCITPIWNACGSCVDSKGGEAACGVEGHWLFQQNNPPTRKYARQAAVQYAPRKQRPKPAPKPRAPPRRQ